MLATVKKWITTNEAYFVYIFLLSIYNIIISSWSISVGSSNLNSDEYEQRKYAVEENYKRVESFSNIETYLFNNYYQLISEFED